LESVLNIHTPISPTLNPIFVFALLQSVAKRKLFLGRKNIGWGNSPHPYSPLLRLLSSVTRFEMRMYAKSEYPHVRFFLSPAALSP
jgi:hypothetical protein